MSIARYAVAESGLAQGETPVVVPTKTPPKRQYVALAEIKAVPEAR